jgi:galactose mutarotase-like enzyme
MTKLFRKSWTKEDLLSYVGDVSALGGVRLAELSDGPGRGVRVADIRTGAGLRCTVLIDRGLDIGYAAFNETPIAFQASCGIRSPYFFDQEGYESQRNFHGGLLSLCGLSAAGHPSEDAFGKHGLHGRVSNTPAQSISVGDHWDGDEYEFWISGQVRESWVFGFNLRMTRKITARLGENRLRVEDTFENLGCEPAPLMLLYHCNFGFPLVAEGSELIVDDVSLKPRDPEAEKGMATYNRFERPQPGYAEQVFYHKVRADEDGYATAAIVNRWLNAGEGLAAYIRWRRAELPELIEWKQMGVVDYAAGVEPANCYPEGRAREAERGTLRILMPGKVMHTELEFGTLARSDEIEALVHQIGGQTP